MSVSLSPEAIQALIALSSALAPTAAQPTPATPAASGQPAPLASFWASDYPGKGVPHHQVKNGKWVDVKGAFCKDPTVAAAAAAAAAGAARRAATAPKPAPAASTYTIAHFAEEHPEAMADLKAAILGTVFVPGGSWAGFRQAVIGR